jgi:hypothetical protein
MALALVGAACGFAGDGPVLAGCAHFVTTVRTSAPSYAPGQTVIITVTQANDGLACTIPPQPCGPPSAVASAYNPAGEDVWDSDAVKVVPYPSDCAPGPVPSMMWPSHYSHTQVIRWSQDECRDWNGPPGHANPDCRGSQVPVGAYRIVGVFYWTDGNLVGKGPSASATITISGKIPLKAAQLRP